MSWVRVWIHFIFTTKDRIPFFDSEEKRKTIFSHIKENSEEKNIWLDSINGYQEHIHCLISIKKDQSISKSVQLIKGESSHWINQNKITNNLFGWQDDYWAVSVSESHLEFVRKYIWDQEEHHKIKSFTEEVNNFMEKYGWTHIKD